jgi:F-type H+-transporting ATPase subunit b
MSSLANLGINLASLIAQIINFGILFLLLRFLAYKPLMRMLDERSRRIKESLEQAERVKQQAALAGEETAKRIDEASLEGRKIVEQAMKAGDAVRHKAQSDANLDAEKLIARARVEISQERDEAVEELRKEFADLTVLAAEKVIKRTLDKEAHRELIDKVLEESTSLKKG